MFLNSKSQRKFNQSIDSKIRFKLNCARTKRRRFRSNPTVINQLKVLAVESEVNSMIVSAKESCIWPRSANNSAPVLDNYNIYSLTFVL